MSIQNQIEHRPHLFARLRNSDTVRTFLACAAAAAIIGTTIFVLAELLDNWAAIRTGIAGLVEAAGGLQFGLVASLALWAMTAASWLCTYRRIDELRWMVISTVITTAYVLMLAGLAGLVAGTTVDELTTYQRLLTYFLNTNGGVSIIVCLSAWFCIGLEYYEDLDF